MTTRSEGGLLAIKARYLADPHVSLEVLPIAHLFKLPLKDISPINWSKDVLSGKKVNIDKG